MCIKWILDKMGQLKTYNDANLANRLVKAEQALKELKTSQRYFMDSTTNFLVTDSTRYDFKNIESYGTHWGYGIQGFMTFVGDKPSKNVVFYPSFNIYKQNGEEIVPDLYLRVVKYDIWRGNYDENVPNVFTAYLDVQLIRTDLGRPYIIFGGMANDKGILNINMYNSYDPHDS